LKKLILYAFHENLDGNVRARDGAQPASDAAPGVNHPGVRVTPGIERHGHCQDVLGTGVVATFATLAAFCIDNRPRHEFTPRRSLAAFLNPARVVAGSDSAATTAL